MDNAVDTLPFVSVVIPVYNDPEGIRRCLESVTNQTYPDDAYEVIVVDNNSSDETPAVVREFPVTLCFETNVQSSYAARNTGLKEACGEILAFTDADCVPEKTWLERGVEAMQERNADLAAGRVRMVFPRGETAAERYDASGNMRNDKSVQRGVAKTANIFVFRRVFNEFGHFPETLISGGDVYWTGGAVDAGHNLVYAEDAIVEHPARGLKQILKKKFRIGRGNVQKWRIEGKRPSRVMFGKLSKIPSAILNQLRDESTNTEKENKTPPDREFEMGIGVFIVGLLGTFAQNFGRLYAIFFGWKG